jgi:hypothetical protein
MSDDKMKQDEPAFPCAAINMHGNSIYQEGLTKREFFAGMAMQGLLSKGSTRAVALTAVDLADALIAELEKGKDETPR